MKKTVKILLPILLILSILLISNIIYCQNTITVSKYNIKTEKYKSSAKIVLISDLHSKEFGENNLKLAEKIKAENPDIIAVVGDMLSLTDQDHKIVIELLENLTDIAPTYYSLGNHEIRYKNSDDLVKDIKNTDTVFLNNEMINIDINGDKITIGGLSEYPYYDFDAPEFNNEERYFLDKFIAQQKDNFSILLAHEPEFYMWKFKDLQLDLMLSGHTHGGLIQVPFIGGLYAPNQGFFPDYTKGTYSSATATMIVSSGLSNSNFIPRINNPAEITVIKIN